MTVALEARASLLALNAFAVPATAQWLGRVRDANDLRALYGDPRVRDLPKLVLGGGTNVLFTSDFPGLVVRVETQGLAEQASAGAARLFSVGAAESWHGVVERLVGSGAGGLENLALIPGSAGAAPVQNIGAYGLELAERLYSVRAWDSASGSEVELAPEQCAFGYRDSLFKHAPPGRYVILSLTLALPRRWEPVFGYAELERELKSHGIERPGPNEIFEAVCAIRRRKLPDPRQIGNAGSFFKNPVVGREKQLELIDRFPSLVSYALAGGRFKLAAGWLIESCGLKGATRGRAGVYEQQALVLVNRGGASGREILELAREIQQRVREKFGVELEPEAVIV
jgi:UDP-N-acetylmuramate dehydrogenase